MRRRGAFLGRNGLYLLQRRKGIWRRPYCRGNGKKGFGKKMFKQYQQQQRDSKRWRGMGLILGGGILMAFGLSYAAVPIYRAYCAATGYGGTVRTRSGLVNEEELFKNRVEDRPLTIQFYSRTDPTMPWKFYPLQDSVAVVPGESVLVFYRAENKSDQDIVGIAAYNVNPPLAGLYFHKRQCFCFDEQYIPAGSTVDLPVLFLIDSDFINDKHMVGVEQIALNYTFFRAEDWEKIPQVGFDEDEQESWETVFDDKIAANKTKKD
eukprot:TRINITY_DN3749_c0_g1_i2.p2 TRINITY_DN3749_c0_g1~~TRINITY_DN3749_c0_g1_i2.p2  ORF type:complete len:264 (+),score=33.15 TRINITY_DN3749_c0_g1_i2:76-867(+)